MLPSQENLIKEVLFKTSRSGGKGGQNVNKVSSKVELVFNVKNSLLFSDEEKELLFQKLASRIDNEGNLHVVSQEDRSQLLNKQRTVIKFIELLTKSLQVQKKRKPTKIPKAIKEKRLANKAVNAAKKESRRKSFFD
jgi:ribosome-associated protein